MYIRKVSNLILPINPLKCKLIYVTFTHEDISIIISCINKCAVSLNHNTDYILSDKDIRDILDPAYKIIATTIAKARPCNYDILYTSLSSLFIEIDPILGNGNIYVSYHRTDNRIQPYKLLYSSTDSINTFKRKLIVRKHNNPNEDASTIIDIVSKEYCKL